MSINLETLIRQTVPAWTYGTVISGSVLSPILNAATDDVYVSGTLFYKDTLTLDNANLVLIGDGPTSTSNICVSTAGNNPPSGTLVTKRFSRIDGFSTVRSSYAWNFPSDAVIHGSVKNIGSLAGTIYFGDVDGNILPPPNLSGLTFDNVLGGNYNFRGGADGLKFLNLHGVCGTSTNNGIIGHSVNGCDVLWDGCHFIGNTFLLYDPRYVEDPDYPVMDSSPTIIKCSPMWTRKSIKNQIVRNCILEGASEETTGFDSLRGTCRCIAKVSANSDAGLGIITLHQETPTVQGYTWAQFPEPLVAGNSIGLHVLITTGPLKGNYYEIVSQVDNTLVLDTSSFPLNGVQIGDFVTVNLAYVENKHHDNHMIASQYLPIGYWGGISWFGSCFGNHAFRNLIEIPGVTPDPNKYAGISDQGIIESSYGFDYKINSRNKTYNNVCVNTGYEFQTRYYSPTDPLEPVSHSAYGFRDTRPLVLNNTGTALWFIDQDLVQLSNPQITNTLTVGFDGQPSNNSFEAVELFTVGRVIGNVVTGSKLGGYRIELVSGASSAVITQDVMNGTTWSATLTGYTGNLVMASLEGEAPAAIIQFAQQPFASAFTSNGFTVNYGTADIVAAILGVAAQTQSSQLQTLIARSLINCVSSSAQTAQLVTASGKISQSGNVQQLGASQLESIIAKISLAGNVQSVQLSQTESAFYGALIGALSSVQCPQIESAIAELSQCGVVTSTQRVQLETIRNLLAMLGLVTNPRIKNVTPVRSFKDLSN